MEGPWGTMDPDKVDGETGNFWRALYKLEKQFTEVPNAQKIAARVRYFSPCTVKSLFNSHLGTEESGHPKEVVVVDRWPLLQVRL